MFLNTALATYNRAAGAANTPANTANDPGSSNRGPVAQPQPLNYGQLLYGQQQPQQFGYQFGPQGVRLGQY